MADLVVVVGVLAFFAVSVLYVAGLDRLVGRDDAEVLGADDAAREEIAAMTEAAR
jgi:hypothetical protein